MHFVEEFVLRQIIINIIIISTHVSSSDISLCCNPSMDEDGAEIKVTTGNTYHNKGVWYGVCFILYHVPKLLQLQERGEELFLVWQMHEVLDL